MTEFEPGADLEDARQAPAAERLLRAWQARYPGNFWLNHELAWLLLHQRVVAFQGSGPLHDRGTGLAE